MSNRIASVDIGTNTVLLLIGEFIADKLTVIDEKYSVARLGEDVDKTNLIKEAAILRTKDILKECAELCKIHNVSKIIAVGTSALRDAENRNDALKELNSELGAKIKPISGDEEAYLSYIGTVSDNIQNMVIDIGGGSTEIIIGKGDSNIKKISLQTGAVRISEKYFNLQHPPQEKLIKDAYSSIIEKLNSINFICSFEKVYAVAGTATTLATTSLGLSDNEVSRINGYKLHRDEINRIYKLYLSMSTNEIINNLKVHPKRADLIFSGSLILKTIVDYYEIPEIIVSSQGLRYGILYDFYKNPAKW